MTHFGSAGYVPTDDETRILQEALDEDLAHPEQARQWSEVRAELWAAP